MFDFVLKLFDKHTWINLAVSVMIILGMILGISIVIYYFPIQIEYSTAEIQDSVVITNTTVYRAWSSLEKKNGIVHLEQKHFIKNRSITNTKS